MEGVIIGAIIAAVATLLGIVISGTINFYVTREQFVRETKRQQDQLIRQKLEEICQVVEEIGNEYRRLWGEALLSIEYGKKIEVGTYLPFDRLSMLINFYAPGLKVYLALLQEVKASFGKVLVEALKFPEGQGINRQSVITDLTAARMAIDKVCQAIATASANIAKKC